MSGERVIMTNEDVLDLFMKIIEPTTLPGDMPGPFGIDIRTRPWLTGSQYFICDRKTADLVDTIARLGGGELAMRTLERLSTIQAGK